MRPLVLLALTGLALTACARTETPDEAHSAALAAQEDYDRTAADARGSGEDDILDAGSSPGQIDTSGSAALTPGEWTVVTVDGERMARFGEEGEAPRITIACEIGGGIDVRLVGMAPQGGSETVYISTPEGGSTFTASNTIGDRVEAYISVPAAAPFIGRLIAANGPYSVRLGGSARITFPASDVLTSVVSSCDRRDTAVTATEAGTVVPAAGEEE
ncbi:hypothetical protein [Parasphingopyxis marina]|uniref:Lipoprotein n=1 Tax=Parasphingopyxis marina TaxID=2761622 RepID=A0A842HYA0_9SPHN|nr:hypothetical protein [Parasphingopyxis marina]MBC2776474.1 hypothetical protein [Parasphingopyxis marina]